MNFVVSGYVLTNTGSQVVRDEVAERTKTEVEGKETYLNGNQSYYVYELTNSASVISDRVRVEVLPRCICSRE